MGGGSFYGQQGYRYLQVREAYRHWSFVAIGAYMRAVAGGDYPQIGRLIPKNQKSAKAIRKAHISSNHEFQEFEPDDPIVRLFHNPNGPDVAYDFWSYVVMFHMLCGYSVIWVIRDEQGFPRELWPVPTQWIQTLQVDSDSRQPANYMIQSPWGQRVEIPYDDTLALCEHSPLNRYEGYAVSTAIAEWLDTYESLVRVRLAQFRNGAVPNIHVALGETYDPDEGFINRFYAKWYARFQGENQAGLPLITGPDVEVKPIGEVPHQLYDTSEDQIKTEVLAAYGVPQALVTGDPTVDTSAYAPMRTFARFRVNPLLKYYGEKFTEKVIRRTKGYEDAVLFWKDQSPDDPQQKLNEWTQLLDRGVYTPNEVRTEKGLEPYEHGGDDPILNGAPIPWASGRKPEPEQELEQEIGRQLALDGNSGASGGYLARQQRFDRNGVRILNGNGKH